MNMQSCWKLCGHWGPVSFFGIFFLPVTMCMPPILNIATELVLPVHFLCCKGLIISNLYLLNELYGYTRVPTPLSPIMVAQPTITPLDFLLMVTVSLFEWGGTFSNILSLTFLACPKVNNIRTVTVQSLSDRIGSLCVSASKFPPLLHNRTGNPALPTFVTPWFFSSRFFHVCLGCYSF